MARELLVEVRRCDRDLAELEPRIRTAVAASGSSVTDVHGVGPIMAAYLIGYTGDVTRFPSTGHYARYNGTAPIDASSGTHIRHRLNPDGNRQLNHALHVAALGRAKRPFAACRSHRVIKAATKAVNPVQVSAAATATRTASISAPLDWLCLDFGDS